MSQEKKRGIGSYLKIYLLGLAMGAADVVPGVSGGTIAFIGGIYTELLRSIRSISWELLSIWKKSGLQGVYKHVNASFLLTLGFGILTSIFSLAKVVSYLLENEAISLWSFFFGLVLASTLFVLRKIENWNFKTLLSLTLGVTIASALLWLEPAQGSVYPLGIFLAATVAISAMILPGISGSFILLLLGVYAPVLEAVKNLEFFTLSIFSLGCLLGLLTFVRVLSWLLKSYKEITLATLTGFMLGSLIKVWPWKKVLSSVVNHKGKIIPIKESCLLPHDFEMMLGKDPMTLQAISFMVLGFILIFLINHFSRRKET